MNQYSREYNAAGFLRTYGEPRLGAGIYNYYGYELIVEHDPEEYVLVPPANGIESFDTLAKRMSGQILIRPPVWHFIASNVMAVPPFNCPIVDGRLVMNAIRRKEFLDRNFNEVGPGKYVLKNDHIRTNSIDLPVIIADTAERKNYCHFITEVLPRLIYYGKKFDDYYIVLSKSISKSFLNIAKSLIDEARILLVEDDQAYIYKEAVVVHSIAENVYSFSKALDIFVEDALPAVAVGGSSEKIYISRRDTDFRLFNDQEAVEGMLKANGYEVIVNSELSFAEQIAVFARARKVAAIHGAGLANLIFSKNLVDLQEYFPRSHQNMSAFWAVASLHGASYSRYLSVEENELSNSVAAKRNVTADKSWFESR